jgi:Asp/Glu/hydantoin racemase
MTSVAKRLKNDFGADVLIMGCAGMARYWNELQSAAGIPVIEPTRAAVAMALAEVVTTAARGR